eukprot:1093277-Prymnesium_polylepis.1
MEVSGRVMATSFGGNSLELSQLQMPAAGEITPRGVDPNAPREGVPTLPHRALRPTPPLHTSTFNFFTGRQGLSR